MHGQANRGRHLSDENDTKPDSYISIRLYMWSFCVGDVLTLGMPLASHPLETVDSSGWQVSGAAAAHHWV